MDAGNNVEVCVCVQLHVFGSGVGQGLDQVQFVSLLARKDGGFFVVFNELLHRVELALSDAVKVVAQLHFEMLVLALRLQRDGKVIWLSRENNKLLLGVVRQRATSSKTEVTDR